MAQIEAQINGCNSHLIVDTETYTSSTITHTPTSLPPEGERTYPQQKQAAQLAVETMICPVARSAGWHQPKIALTSGDITLGDLSLLPSADSTYLSRRVAIFETFFAQALTCDCWQTDRCPLSDEQFMKYLSFRTHVSALNESQEGMFVNEVDKFFTDAIYKPTEEHLSRTNLEETEKEQMTDMVRMETSLHDPKLRQKEIRKKISRGDFLIYQHGAGIIPRQANFALLPEHHEWRYNLDQIWKKEVTKLDIERFLEDRVNLRLLKDVFGFEASSELPNIQVSGPIAAMILGAAHDALKYALPGTLPTINMCQDEAGYQLLVGNSSDNPLLGRGGNGGLAANLIGGLCGGTYQIIERGRSNDEAWVYETRISFPEKEVFSIF